VLRLLDQTEGRQILRQGVIETAVGLEELFQ
jgi:hypothetical protein